MFVYPWLDMHSVSQLKELGGSAQTPLEFYGMLRSPFVMIFHLPIISDVRHHCEAPIHQCVTSCDILPALPAPSSTVWTCLDQVYGRGQGHGLGQVAAFKVMLDSSRFCLMICGEKSFNPWSILPFVHLCS